MEESMLVLVTGSAGFIGTNLVGELLDEGKSVIGVDNLVAAEAWKAELYLDSDRYEFIEADIGDKDLGRVLGESRLMREVGGIGVLYNLACIASPPRYKEKSLETIRTSTVGVVNMLELAKQYDCPVFQASTSEVYGDPERHPQSEDYWGNVNTMGPRSCYDESKRLAETCCYEYHRLFGVQVKVGRIFNTYGPYMDPADGRVVSNFINQALRGEDLTVYGDGSHTRSFQYINDLLAGIGALMDSDKDFIGPVNLGNPGEFTVLELAERVLSLVPNSGSQVVHLPEDVGDPKVRRPDISLAREKLGWEPRIGLGEGLKKTVAYFGERSKK